MMFTVRVGAEAELDWHEAVLWYEERGSGNGQRLNVAVRDVLNILAQQPERFPLVTGRTRKVRVSPPWPYAIYFTVNPQHREIKVLAIWHGARNPEELRRRLK
jgi:plasmid stabilization system protein ParE